MVNLNPNFSGNFEDNDLLAYIDEAGDEGFTFERKCTKWFLVSSIVLTLNESVAMLNTFNTFRNRYCPTRNLNKCTFKDFGERDRKNLLKMLAKHNYLTVHASFYKPDIDPKNIMCTYPSMYFIGILDVLERLTWLTKQFGKRRVHVLISNRNSISSQNLKEYLFTKSIRANANLWYEERIGKVSLSTPSNHAKLLFGDYSASSMFQTLEETEEGAYEETYFNLFLHQKLYVSNHAKHGGVWNNGFKCTPDEKSLLKNSGILEEGAHTL